MDDEELKQILTFRVGLPISDNSIMADGMIEPNSTDFMRGLVVTWQPTCKAFCVCGRPECKGAIIGPRSFLVMQ